MRIEDNDLAAELVADKVEWGYEIRIAADDDERLCSVCVGVLEKFGDEIHVGALLLHLHHMHITFNSILALAAFGVHGRNPRLVLVVVALYDFHAAMRLNGAEVEILPFYCGGIMRIGLHAGGKIFDIDKVMAF